MAIFIPLYSFIAFSTSQISLFYAQSNRILSCLRSNCWQSKEVPARFVFICLVFLLPFLHVSVGGPSRGFHVLTVHADNPPHFHPRRPKWMAVTFLLCMRKLWTPTLTCLKMVLNVHGWDYFMYLKHCQCCVVRFLLTVQTVCLNMRLNYSM